MRVCVRVRVSLCALTLVCALSRVCVRLSLWLCANSIAHSPRSAHVTNRSNRTAHPIASDKQTRTCRAPTRPHARWRCECCRAFAFAFAFAAPTRSPARLGRAARAAVRSDVVLAALDDFALRMIEGAIASLGSRYSPPPTSASASARAAGRSGRFGTERRRWRRLHLPCGGGLVCEGARARLRVLNVWVCIPACACACAWCGARGGHASGGTEGRARAR